MNVKVKLPTNNQALMKQIMGLSSNIMRKKYFSLRIKLLAT